MATIIDQLLITLGLDTKNLEDNSKKAQESLKQTGAKGAKNLSEIDLAGQKAAQALVKMKNEALTLTSVLLGGMGLKEFVSHTVQANIQTGNLSKNIGMSVNDLRAWRNAAEAAGGSADDIQGALGSMNDALQTYRLQGKVTGPMEFFSSLGISARDSKGNLISADEGLMRISNALQSRPFQEQAAILQKMGFGSGATPFLTKGPAGIQEALAEMHKLGDATEDAYESSRKLNEQFVKLGVTLNKVATTLEHIAEGPAGKFLSDMVDGLEVLDRNLHDKNYHATQVVKAPPGTATTGNKAFDNAIRGTWLGTLLLGSDSDAAPAASSGPAASSPQAAPASSAGLFESLERKYGLPAGLLDSIWSAESGRGKNMLSPKGAMGHFQFIPSTAKAYGLTDPGNLGQSADAAARMMRDLLSHYGGNLQAALAGYNWGSGNLDSNGMGRLPSETRAYIAKVMGAMPLGASARFASSGGPVVNNTTVNIGTITTKATDADGLGRDLPSAIKRHTRVAQASTGFN